MSQRKDETLEEYNARMNEYMKARYFRRRAEAIEKMGGRCIDCLSPDMLEFDHVDPSEKEFNVGALFAGASHDKLWSELSKCVLRCVACHSHITALQKLQTVNLLRL